MVTKPTLPDEMCLPTAKPAYVMSIYLVAYQVDYRLDKPRAAAT